MRPEMPHYEPWIAAQFPIFYHALSETLYTVSFKTFIRNNFSLDLFGEEVCRVLFIIIGRYDVHYHSRTLTLYQQLIEFWYPAVK